MRAARTSRVEWLTTGSPLQPGTGRRILEHVDRCFGVLVAENVLNQLVSAFERIGETPGIGHRRPDLTEDDQVRFWPVGPSLLAYRVKPGHLVEILFVERGERDWGRVLEQGD